MDFNSLFYDHWGGRSTTLPDVIATEESMRNAWPIQVRWFADRIPYAFYGMAEKVGFEPTVSITPRPISNRVP